jgi:hypothetical protein
MGVLSTPTPHQKNHVQTLIMTTCLMRFFRLGKWAPLFFAMVLSAEDAPAPLPRPFLIVEMTMERSHVSDLYAFNFEGRLLKRLSPESLPSCSLAGIGPDSVTFVANASAFYDLSLRHGQINALHAGYVETAGVSLDGNGVAHVSSGSEDGNRRFLRVRPLLAGSPYGSMEIPLPGAILDPASERFRELLFAPDGRSIVLSSWTGLRASILRFDLKERDLKTWLSDPVISYYSPAFSPDGQTMVCVREDPRSGEWALVVAPVTGREARPLLTAPAGAALYCPVFADEGRFLVFEMDGVLARMPASGGAAEGLSGQLDWRPRDRGLNCRTWPGRPDSKPPVAGRWIAWIDRTQQGGTLQVIDARTKEKRIVRFPGKNLRAAVVVE